MHGAVPITVSTVTLAATRVGAELLLMTIAILNPLPCTIRDRIHIFELSM